MNGPVLAGTKLVLAQPRRLRREFELRSGEDVVGTMRWQGIWKPVAHLEAGGSRWSVARERIWHPRYVARDEVDGAAVAALDVEKSSGAGTLQMGGETLSWTRVPSHGAWGFRTAAGFVPATFHRRGTHVDVTVALDAGDVPPLSFLLLLGSFLMIVQAQAAATSAGAVAAAA